MELLADKTQVFPSRGELRRMVQGGGLSLNKVKVDDAEQVISKDSLLNQKYILIQKGKKNYYLITVK
jgi:tyrosyl-tRNA synthetase